MSVKGGPALLIKDPVIRQEIERIWQALRRSEMGGENLTGEARRKSNLVRVGGVPESMDRQAFIGPSGGATITAAKIVSNMPTTGSTAVKKWTFTLKDLTANKTIATRNTNGADLVADKAWSLGTISNESVAAGAVLELQIVKTGAPTDLIAAEVAFQVDYEVTA